jgi:hypothetical protein
MDYTYYIFIAYCLLKKNHSLFCIHHTFDPNSVRRQSCVQKRQPVIGQGTTSLLKIDAKHKRHLFVIDIDHFLNGHTQIGTHILFHTQNGVTQLNFVSWLVTVVDYLTIRVVGITLAVDMKSWKNEKCLKYNRTF